MKKNLRRSAGFTLVEVLVAVGLLSVLIAGLSGVVSNSTAIREEGASRNERAREAQFAMQRILEATANSPAILVPLAEDVGTGNIESVFEDGVLALRLDPTLDRDRDGFADADNDKDGRVDEDWPRDANFDGNVGIVGVDDDNSGFTDFSFGGDGDDDETGSFGGASEDPVDGIDNDGDGVVDEDPSADMTGDGFAGWAFVDDDGDGLVDEGDEDDDDEDGLVDEDWIDNVVFILRGTNLVERLPDPNPTDGANFFERVIATDVQRFRVERKPREGRRFEVVRISLEVGSGDSAIVLDTQVRVGGALAEI